MITSDGETPVNPTLTPDEADDAQPPKSLLGNAYCVVISESDPAVTMRITMDNTPLKVFITQMGAPDVTLHYHMLNGQLQQVSTSISTMDAIAPQES